jgi:signal transduction histidine kinase
LSIASHELKTPLTTLQLSVQRLAGWPRSEPAEPGWMLVLQKIERATRRMSLLADDLIEVTRAGGARLRLVDIEDVDLSQVARDVISGMQDEIVRSGSRVRVRAMGSVSGHWDRRRLDEVVANLLSNAVKFGSKKPVVIAIDGDETHVRLRVRDHGVGIPLHEQSRIFERFGRAVSDRHYGGFGLGLWIARQVVEAHGGVIAVRSEPGKGATFTVELPRSAPSLTVGATGQVELHATEHH